MKKFNVHWQSGTKEGTIEKWADDGRQAYLLASQELTAVCRKLGIEYMNVTIEEVKPE